MIDAMLVNNVAVNQVDKDQFDFKLFCVTVLIAVELTSFSTDVIVDESPISITLKGFV